MPAADDVRAMFGAIAWRYDTLNRVLSLGTDRAWRRRTCDLLAIAPGELAADLCCGTGDLSMEMASRGARVVGVDFSPEMLRLAATKGLGGLAEADCLRLPFPDGVFDVVTVAFGVRNLADLRAGLAEILRVLRPGGRAGILEFASPGGRVFPYLYRGYLRWVLPAVGAALARRRAAYVYLGTSIQAFPDQPRMKQILRETGFDRVSHVDFARGIAALYIAHRAG